MFNQMIVGRYIQGDSVIHGLDPRTKLILSFFFIIIIFLADNWLAYFVVVLFMLMTILLTRVSLTYFLKGLRPMFWLILFTVVFQILFTSGGRTYFEWGIIRITELGLQNAGFIMMRLILIITMSTVLTLTTSPLEITDGIEHLFRPLKRFGFPAHELALMLSIALRYVPTLMDEAVKIMNAQKSRGVEFDQGNLMKRVKAIIPILLPLFISAFNRADEMATAMESRGYRGGEGRSKYRQLQYTGQDFCAAMCIVILIVVLVYLRWFLG